MTTKKPTISRKDVIDRLGKVDFAKACRNASFKMAGTGVAVSENGRVSYHTSLDLRPVLTDDGIKTVESVLDAKLRHVEEGDYYLAGGHERWLHAYAVPSKPHFCLNKDRVARVEYTLESEKFIMDAGIKLGDKVEVVQSAQSCEGGWDNSWVPGMKVGVVGIVDRIDHSTGIWIKTKDEARLGYPYFCVRKYEEPVKAPEISAPKESPEPVVLPGGLPVQPGDLCGSPLLPTMQSYSDKNPAYTSDSFRYHRIPWTTKDYELRQQTWVDFYKLEVGGKVRVCGKVESSRDGWGDSWTKEMDSMVGKIASIVRIKPSEIIVKVDESTTWGVPFYVLQPQKKSEVAPVEPKYRRFESVKEVTEFVKKHGPHLIVNDPTDGESLTSVSGAYVDKSSGKLRILCCFGYSQDILATGKAFDGTPFGVRV